MKKLVLILFVIGLLMVLIIPMSVLAGKPQEVKVIIKNSTGAPLGLSLTDASGNLTWLDVDVPQVETTLTEGIYSYYASTVCGVKAGSWNLPAGKVLWLKCVEEEPELLEFRIGAGYCDSCHNKIGEPLN